MSSLFQQLFGSAGATLTPGTTYLAAYDPAGLGISGDGAKPLTPDEARSYVGTPISFNLANPGGAENIVLLYTRVALTFAKIISVLKGSATPSVTFSIRYGTDTNASGTEMKTGGITTTSVTTGDATTSLTHATIPAGNWVWFTTTAQSGTVTAINVTLAP